MIACCMFNCPGVHVSGLKPEPYDIIYPITSCSFYLLFASVYIRISTMCKGFLTNLFIMKKKSYECSLDL